MSAIDLVVTDLDGTFWHGHEQVHPDALTAWRTLEAAGITVMVATGRRVASTRTPLAGLGLAPVAAVMNGALVLELANGHRHHRHAHAPDLARAVVSAFRAHGVEPCVYVDHDEFDVVVGGSPATHPQHFASLGASVRQLDLEEVVDEVPVLMFGVVGHPELPLHAVATTIGDAAEVHVSGPDQWGGYTITATPVGLSKWVAVTTYCDHAGIDHRRVLAIGDGPNDLELLEAAAISVVPASGCTAALARADHVVASPADGGWAQLVEIVGSS